MENTFTIVDGVLIKVETIVNGNVILPPHITSIKEFAFSSCKELISITLSNNIVKIGEYAFHCCKNLKSIIFSDNITIIEEGVCHNCPSLLSITLPNNIREIKKNAFCGCYSLISMGIPHTIQTISKGAFFLSPDVIYKLPIVSNIFIVWALKSMRNRNNLKFTSIKNCHNLLACITVFAQEPKRKINPKCFEYFKCF